jgi:hypothetical protein
MLSLFLFLLIVFSAISIIKRIVLMFINRNKIDDSFDEESSEDNNI